MAEKYKRMTQQDKLEQERAIAEKLERENKRKRIIMTVVVVLLCLALVGSFCFPAISVLLS